MISVASEMSGHSPCSHGVSQLPVQVTYEFIIHLCQFVWVPHLLLMIPCLIYLTSSNSQVLTLQASNLTSEDLTLTVLAPASFTSPPSVVSLNSSPSSPMSPFVGFSEFNGMARLGSAPLVSDDRKENGDGGTRSVSFNEQASPASHVVPGTGMGCTHLWLQSRVPLG